MKKLLISTFVLTMLTLTACCASVSPTANSDAPTGSLPMATQLIIGTMKLDGTEQDVTAQQAAELLPMWQVYSQLLTTDTAAQAEIDGLLSQIRETLTDEQIQAITKMNLTQQDVMSLIQEQGIAVGGGQGISADQIATAQASRGSGGGSGFTPPDGGIPPGGGPDAGGGFGGGQGLSPDQIATAQAVRGSGGGGGFNQVPPALVQALIQFLQEKAGS